MNHYFATAAFFDDNARDIAIFYCLGSMLTHVFEVASDFLETRSWLEDKFAVPFGEPGAGAVQWSLNDDKEFEYSLNDNRLTPSAYDYGCGAFELYPTTNHYQFILLNKANGKQWHVQWGFEKKRKDWSVVFISLRLC